MVANTVVRVDSLWLTSHEAKGDTSISRAGGFNQRRCELHHAAETLGIFRQRGNQGRARKRSREIGPDIWLLDDGGDSDSSVPPGTEQASRSPLLPLRRLSRGKGRS